jgi:DNA (cytosine-5)-methyltransferase 1
MKGVDLFCKAGGCTEGYKRAFPGIHMTGVDIEEQPNYCGDDFIRADALEISLSGYDFVHASPPCQAYSTTASLHDNEYPQLVDWVRCRLLTLDVPWVIENVVGAPLRNPLMLCGSSFGLGVRRHRLFETSPMIPLHPPCVHHLQPEPIDVTGTGGPGGRHRKPNSLQEARDAMGIQWMSRRELSAAVPPAFTEWIGLQLLASLKSSAA